MPPPWTTDLLRTRLAAAPGAGLFARNVVYFERVGSTNDVCRDLAQTGAPEGTLVLAGEQTAGRGRLGRSWYAPPDGALLMSLLFRPGLAPAQVNRLTMLCSLAAAEAVETHTGLPVSLKWPNDLLLGEAKFGGVLAEVGLTGERVDYVVVGMGLNVNFDPAELPETRAPATSLQQAFGRPLDRLALLVSVIERVAARYAALERGAAVRGDWQARLITLGRRVTVSGHTLRFEGRAEGVDDDGALLVRRDDGALEVVHAGDVTLSPAG
jgi:BirA family biotin operon repressor/biotin-[acetyl-CoA-carboxylase] ligase